MSLLSAPLVLGDVRDGEGLVRRALDEYLREKGAYFRPDVYEEAMLSGLERMWRLWIAYNRKSRPMRFTTFAFRGLKKWWIVDFYRTQFTDTRYSELPTFVDLSERDQEEIAEQIGGGMLEVLAAMRAEPTLSPNAHRTLKKIVAPIVLLRRTQDDVAAELGCTKVHLIRYWVDFKAEVKVKHLLEPEYEQRMEELIAA
jgi:hypothetical protein